MATPHDPTDEQTDGLGDLTGLELVHNNRDLGTIEEILEHSGRHYVVVDTRHWTFGNRRIVPLELVGHDIDLRGQQHVVRSPFADPAGIRDAPDFDPFRLDDDGYWESIDDHYDDHGSASTAVVI